MKAAIKSVAASVILVGAFVAVPGIAMAKPGPPSGYVPANVRVAQAVKAYSQAHPNDYVGLNRAIVEAGGSPVRFSFERAGLVDLTPEVAQLAYDASVRASGSQVTAPAAIPTSAFTVSGFWSHEQDQYGEWWTYFGSWDFSPAYASGQAPDDAMGVQTRDVRATCWRNDGTGGWASDVNNRDASHRLSIRGADVDSTVFSVEDANSSRLVDHGTVYISYKNIKTCASAGIYGKTYYEHNLSGCNCSWGFSISASVFSISYNQSDPPESRQKSTALIYQAD